MAPLNGAKGITRNINHYKRLLAAEHDPKRRQAIIRQLSEEEANLRWIRSRRHLSAG